MNRFSIKLRDKKLDSDVYNIVVCADRKLINPVMVLMKSAQKHLYKKINFYILQSAFTKINKDNLYKFANDININLKIIQLDKNDFYGFNVKRLPVETYYYYKAHELIPEEFDRESIMDVDTLFLKDIEDLYNADFEDQYLIAGNEYDTIKYSDYLSILSNSRPIVRRRLYNEENCFNSGVILMNLKKFWEENISVDSFRSFVRQEDMGGFFHDQLILNRFVQGRVKFFPRLFYNSSPIFIRSNREKLINKNNYLHEVFIENEYSRYKENSIIHFCGVGCKKPWRVHIQIDKNNIVNIINENDIFKNEFYKLWWEIAAEIPSANFSQMASKCISNKPNINSNINVKEKDKDLKRVELFPSLIRKIYEARDKFINFIRFNMHK